MTREETIRRFSALRRMELEEAIQMYDAFVSYEKGIPIAEVYLRDNEDKIVAVYVDGDLIVNNRFDCSDGGWDAVYKESIRPAVYRAFRRMLLRHNHTDVVVCHQEA